MAMKNFPFIPLIMITTMIMIIIHGHRVSRETQPKAVYSTAAGVDAHLASARDAFISDDSFVFRKELEKATELISKEAYCDNCIDKQIALQSLPMLVDVKHKYQQELLDLDELDRVFGQVITALAKNHILYTIDHLTEEEAEFYLEDAVRHLKYSMKYASNEELKEKERVATNALEEALKKHQIDEEKAKKLLEEVVKSI